MKSLDAARPRLLCDDRPVEGPYRRSQNQVRLDSGLIERFQHANFDGAPLAPSSEDIGGVDVLGGHGKTLVVMERANPPCQDWSSSMYHSVKSVHWSSSLNLITKRLR